jgi:hypothetical protein
LMMLPKTQINHHGARLAGDKFTRFLADASGYSAARAVPSGL